MRAVLLACALLMFAQGAYAEKGEPFGLQSAEDPSYRVQWARATAEIERSKAEPGVQARIAGIPQGRQAQIEWVNDKVNSLFAKKALDKYQPWPEPKYVFSGHGTDCLGKALAKILLFRAAGIPPGDIRLVVGSKQDLHAVVAVWDGSRWVILDNLYGAKILDDSVASSFTPSTSLKLGS